ncbi:hypothetical protein IWQ47_002201 [Aquimarina sp. EL_43]|nr:hypothetical protein [Aquimarina sp. EL_35]MBG6151116.1 hypothetical protein [Aquimarina sp. EL_32]MBG6169127.1 hypothetical protein [Aquimarina sp. EL_43]
MKYYNSCLSNQNTTVQFQKMKLEYFNPNKKTSYITVTGPYHLYILILKALTPLARAGNIFNYIKSKI